jgi:hypothetical protein
MAISALAHTSIARETLADTVKLLKIAERHAFYPLEALRRVQGALDMLEQAERSLVAGAREDGCTWEDVGEAMGTTRQAASQRFGASAVDSERAS